MSSTTKSFSKTCRHRILGCLLFGALMGCDETGTLNFADVFKPKPETAAASDPAAGAATQDVEMPDVFSASEPGLWDGRPSLGGVWVAHPDVTNPERVIIRNLSNGQFVVGALFRRERDIPGPRLQMSSDAAQALGVLAGAPVDLEVVALRKQIIEQAPVPTSETLSSPPDITETSLDPIAAAAAAIDAAPTGAAEPDTPVAISNLPPSTLGKPFIQIGIFSQEANAERAAKQMRGAGLIPTVKQQTLGGKPFWRVIVGPASNAAEHETLLATIKGEGFSDAFAVAN